MTRWGVVLAVGLFSCSWAKAQEDTAHSPPIWSLRIAPLGLIDPFGPSSVQLGVEHALRPGLSLGLDGGYFYEYRPRLGAAQDQAFNGWMVRGQLLHWSHRSGRMNGLGFDVAYKYTSGTCRDSIKPEGEVPFSKDYDLARSVIMIRGYATMRTAWGRHFWSEGYVGFGMRYKSTRSSGITPEEIDAIDDRDEMGDQSEIGVFQHGIGDAWLPDVVLGWRIGYALK